VRVCVICGGTKEDGREQTTYDFCQICIGKDTAILQKRHEEKEASQTPGMESQEA